MLIQPEWGNRDVNRLYYECEAHNIAKLNTILENVELTTEETKSLVWLAGTEKSTINNIVSAMQKALDMK